MKKKAYIKPTLRVVELQHQHQLLIGSVSEVQSYGTDPLDVLYLNNTPIGSGFLGR